MDTYTPQRWRRRRWWWKGGNLLAREVPQVGDTLPIHTGRVTG